MLTLRAVSMSEYTIILQYHTKAFACSSRNVDVIQSYSHLVGLRCNFTTNTIAVSGWH